METENILKIAGQLSTNKLDALQKIATGNGSIYRGDFDALLSMGLVDMTGITPLGNQVIDLFPHRKGALIEPAAVQADNGRAEDELVKLRRENEMLSRDLQMARDALIPFYKFWVKWFDSDGILAGSPEMALDFGEWFWHNAESEDIVKAYKGAVDAINKAEML